MVIGTLCVGEPVFAWQGEGMSAGKPLSVMTYNLRFANETDPHPWSARRPLLTELLRESAPHLLGVQEGLRPQLDQIAEGLADHYTWVGQSRLGDTEDEYCAIYVDRRRFDILDVDQRWLSTTPQTPGSLSWGRHPRIVTAVSLAERDSGARLLMLNTHLDYWSLTARRFSAELLADYLDTSGGGRPVVLTGDFNTGAHISAVHRRLQQAGLVDVFDRAAHPGPDHPTFNDYQPPRTRGPRIDWIFVSAQVQVDSCGIVTRHFDGRYPSDHLPVQAALRLPV